jgi:hypothetical protein
VYLQLAGDHVLAHGGALERELRLSFPPRDVAGASACLAEALRLAVPPGPSGGGTLRVHFGGIWLRWLTWPWQGTPPAESPDWVALPAPQAFRMPGVMARVPSSLVDVLRPYLGPWRLECAATPELAVAVSGRRGEQKNSSVVAVVEPDCLTFLRLNGSYLVDVYAQPGVVAASTASAQVEEAWHRLALREVGFSEGGERAIVSSPGLLSTGTEIAGVRAVVVDAQSLQRRPAALLAWPFDRSPWRGWKGVACAASLVLVIMSLVHLQRALREQAVRHEARAVVTAPLAPAATRSLAEQKDRSARITRINDAVRLLNAPVEALLAAARPASGSGTALLALQLRTGKEQALVLEGTAATMQGMADYVKMVAAKPVFTSVWLSRHTTASPEEGGGFHFQIEARWRE